MNYHHFNTNIEEHGSQHYHQQQYHPYPNNHVPHHFNLVYHPSSHPPNNEVDYILHHHPLPDRHSSHDTTTAISTIVPQHHHHHIQQNPNNLIYPNPHLHHYPLHPHHFSSNQFPPLNPHINNDHLHHHYNSTHSIQDHPSLHHSTNADGGGHYQHSSSNSTNLSDTIEHHPHPHDDHHPHPNDDHNNVFTDLNGISGSGSNHHSDHHIIITDGFVDDDLPLPSFQEIFGAEFMVMMMI